MIDSAPAHSIVTMRRRPGARIGWIVVSMKEDWKHIFPFSNEAVWSACMIGHRPGMHNEP